MPNPKPLRNVRVDDRLWQAAAAAAERNDETVSAVIRRALASYVKRHPEPVEVDA